MRATISILGFYRWNPEIFANLETPTRLNRDDVISTILYDCAELELIYSDYDMMQNAIGLWSRANMYIWDKLIDTMYFEYNPIYNTYRNESWSNVIKDDGITKNTRNLQESTFNDYSENTENIREVSAFNTMDFSNAEKNTGDTSGIGENSTSYTGDTNENRTNKRSDSGERSAAGNIGVTTTQHMIREEREVVQFNIYQFISDSFKNRFCIEVY